MSKQKRYAAEEIIAKLREAEVHLAQGQTVSERVHELVDWVPSHWSLPPALLRLTLA